MPLSLHDWHDRIKAVEREYRAVRISIVSMRTALAQGTGDLTAGKLGDLITAAGNLEATYLIRLWAEFETAVRSYYGWLTHDPDTRIGTHDLIIAVADVRRGRAISEDVRRAVHGVREFRNRLVHARNEPATPVSLTSARHELNTYLCKLPDTWG